MLLKRLSVVLVFSPYSQCNSVYIVGTPIAYILVSITERVQFIPVSLVVIIPSSFLKKKRPSSVVAHIVVGFVFIIKTNNSYMFQKHYCKSGGGIISRKNCNHSHQVPCCY